MPTRTTGRTRKEVVIIGPGKIGCGYLAPLFAEAGWHVVLAARSEAAALRIDSAGWFTVRTTGEPEAQRVDVRAVAVGSAAFDRAIARADLVATAVGSSSIQDLSAPLAAALARRPPARPLDVWAVENADIAPILDVSVRAAAKSQGLRLPPVGFAGAIAWTAVAHGDWKKPRRPEFVRDDCRRMVVDQTRCVAPVPALPGVEGTDRYEDRLQTKRLVFGAGHALAAYLGARTGHRYIDEVVADPSLRPVIEGSLAAARDALGRERGGHGEDESITPEWVMARFANADLADPVARVARDPLRKLAVAGPLIGAARLVHRVTGTVPPGFAAAIAGALAYHDARDSQSCRLAERLAGREDVRSVLRDVSGLESDDPLTREVVRRYRRISRPERSAGSPLNLSLAV